jgi:hypothetical protein
LILFSPRARGFEERPSAGPYPKALLRAGTKRLNAQMLRF